MTALYSMDLLLRQLLDAEEDVLAADWAGNERLMHYAQLRVIQLKNLIALLSEKTTSTA